MKTKICGIYKITSPSGKIYIGQSVNIEGRWKNYNKVKPSFQRKLCASLEKYGFENHKFEIVEECSRELLNEREIYWIKFYDTFDTQHGLNLQKGGFNGSPSKETREKIARSLKGQKHSEERREKIRVSHIGKITSEKTKEKLRLLNIGNQYGKGYKFTEKQKEKLRASNTGNERMIGKKHSEETKEKLRLKNKK